MSTNVSPISKQCNVKGVAAIILKCSKDQCIDVKSNKAMTKDLAETIVMLVEKRSRQRIPKVELPRVEEEVVGKFWDGKTIFSISG